ncbi:Uncharacterized protein QTN25_003247 [Entamoeba marina]
MFDDSNRLLSDTVYEHVQPSKNRAFRMINKNKRVMAHMLLHFSLQGLFLFVGVGISIGMLFVTDHPTGEILVKIEIAFSIASFVLFLIDTILFILSLYTHPIFTLLPQQKFSLLFTKICNMLHTIYLLFLVTNVILCILLSMSFNPTNEFNHPISSLWLIIVMDIVYLQISLGELQKPITTRFKPQEQVEMSSKPDSDDLQDFAFKTDVGVITFGYNILGFELYVKYIFDPNHNQILPEIYFIGWVKEFN